MSVKSATKFLFSKFPFSYFAEEAKYDDHFINNPHYVFTRMFYFSQYLLTILLCGSPASQ